MSRDFVLQAMRIGVRDVLPLPLQMSELDHSLDRIGNPQSESQPQDPPKASSPGRLIAFIGCKGGCGTTFLSTNLAYLMANEFEADCAFIDLDLQFGDASFYLADGLNQNSLTDLTRSMDRLDAQLLASCMHSVIPGLDLLAAPADAESALHIQAQSLAKVIELTRQSHDVVVMDMDRSLDALALKALDMADRIYVVMDELMISVRDAKRLVTLFRSLGYTEEKLRLVVNRHRTGAAIAVKDIEAAVGLRVDELILNHFEQVSEALNLGKPLSQLHPNSPIVQSLRHAAADLLQKPLPRARGWLDRLIPQAA
jgi:pilus assembly protein CpaE